MRRGDWGIPGLARRLTACTVLAALAAGWILNSGGHRTPSDVAAAQGGGMPDDSTRLAVSPGADSAPLERPVPGAFARMNREPLPRRLSENGPWLSVPAGRASRLDAPAAPNGWAMFDGFEHPDWPDPNLWHAVRTQPPAWWPSTCRVRSGLRGFWAFGGPTSRGEVPCAAPVPAGTSSAAYQWVDLRQATAASRLDLFFDLWLAFPPNSESGLFINLMVPEGETFRRVTVFGATSAAGQWITPVRRLDLMALTDIVNPLQVYDLRGQAWHIEWLALAPNGANAGSGVFIDNLSMVWEPDPAVATPTVRPTLPPTATLTPTATRTPTPTLTPAAPAFLPVALRSWDIRATATPEPQ